MKEVIVSDEEFREKLRRDPRIGEEYVESIELPLAFATGNKFLKNHIIEKSDYTHQSNLPSDWFQFSQQIEEIEVEKEKLILRYSEEKETHPPFMSRKGIGP